MLSTYGNSLRALTASSSLSKTVNTIGEAPAALVIISSTVPWQTTTPFLTIPILVHTSPSSGNM